MSSNQTAPSSSTLQGQYAGFISRLIALLIDVLLVTAALIITGLAFQLIVSFFNLDQIFGSTIESMIENSSFLTNLLPILAAAGSFYFVFFIYYISLLTVTGGMTVGKATMGVRVVRMDGTMLTFGRSTRRYVTFLLAALPLFLGLFWVLIDDRRQGWHDKLSSTCVIYDWPAQEDERFLHGIKSRLNYGQATRSRGVDAAGNSDQTSPPTETTETTAVSPTST